MELGQPSHWPEGVITLLLTDVVGSTRTWEAHPDAMAAAMARHDAIIGEEVAAHGGALIKRRGEGDATFSVFQRATDAAATAVALQQALEAETWPEPVRLSVRVAVHTGEAQLRDGDYFGTAVNRAARLRAVAGGGQILCSEATAAVIADSLPAGVTLADQGSQILKDLSRPEHIFSLQWPGAATIPVTSVGAPARPFVGRARELEAAFRALGEAMAGRGGALLITGEPGIGKTRLAEEVEARARNLGATVVWGRCLEEEGTPPFWPWRQVLRACLARGDGAELLEHVGPAAGDLAAIVPDLVPREGVGRQDRAAPPPGGEERFRLFETVSATLSAAARPGGLVVILDDVHWADPSSAQLLAHLGPDLSTARMLLITTYRDREMTADHPAAAALASLARLRGTVRLALDGLGDVEVADQLEATFGRRFDVEVVAGVARRSHGNPFFVAEIGQLLDQAAHRGQLGSGDWEQAVPEGARGLIARRLDRLAPAARELLRTAAVAGTAIDVGALASACALPPEEVLDHLDAAAAAGLVASGPGPAVFSHALVRDTLVSEVPASQRVGVHLRLAEHLESAHGDELDRHAAAIAHHRLAALPAGDPRRAVAWAERAASSALDALAYEEAARFYERALAAMASGGFSSEDRCGVLVSRAEALMKSGEVTSAIACAADAGDEARQAGDPIAMAKAACCLDGMSDLTWAHRSVGLAEDALARLPDDEVETRARVMAALATQTSLLEDANRADTVSRQALELAEAAGSPTALMSALRARQMARSDPDGVQDRQHVADRMLALAAETRDQWAGAWGRLWRIDAHCQLGEMDAAEAELARVAEIAARVRQPLMDWHVARTSLAIAMARGRFADAGRYLTHAAALSRRFDPRARLMHDAAGCKLAALTGDTRYDLYADELEREDVPASRAMVHLQLALLHARRGDLDRAVDHYNQLPGWPAWQPPHFVALMATNERARATAIVGDIDGARVAYDRLVPWAQYFAVGGSGLVTITGSVHLALGCLAALLGRTDASIGHLRSAIDANSRAGLLPYEAEAQFELARVLIRGSTSNRSEALVLASDAGRTAARLGMQPLAAEAEALAASLRGRAGSTAAPGLTKRENEIVALVGRGLTNRQIAELLHISERTAENHVQHILTKLDLGNRSQVAAWVAAKRPGEPGR